MSYKVYSELAPHVIKIEPVDKDNKELSRFINMGIEAANEFLEKNKDNKRLCRTHYVKVNNDLNEYILQANYQYLVNHPNLQEIRKQLAYITFMRTAGIYDMMIFDDWENNFKHLEKMCLEAPGDSSTDTNNKSTIKNKSTQNNKARWTKSTSLLAYTFWRLKKEGLLQSDTLAANIASFFVDSNYRDISNDTMNTYFDRFEKLNTQPHGYKQVDEILKIIKELANS